jgi:hypothetical protein
MKLNRMWMPAMLAMAASTAWADEVEELWPLPTPTLKPAAPLLPSLGSYSKVTAGSAVFRGCADYSMGSVWASDPGEFGRKTAVCDDTVYDQETKVFTSTTRGERIGAVASGGNAGFSGSADGWKNASGAGATATANLQKEGHVFNLKVGAQARNGRDVLFSITPTYDPWTAAQNGWREGSSNGAWWLEDGINSQGAGAIARMADRFVVEGTGFVKMTFTVDGLYEKGDSLPVDAGGGKFSFGVGLFNPDSLVEFDVGGDTGTVRMWQQATFGGFALGRDLRDAPFAFQPFISAEDLLGSKDFEAPQSSALPSAQLPDEPTFMERSVTVTLPAQDGQTLWLVAGLWASASGWNPCDPIAGDGNKPNVAIILDPDDDGPGCGGRTVVDFTSTAKLSALELGGSITGLVGASGVDYRLAVASQPIPEPGTYALMLSGLAGIAALARRQRRPG